MANFMGGSAPAMANQVAEGFILLSANSLKGFTPGDLNLLRSSSRSCRATRGRRSRPRTTPWPTRPATAGSRRLNSAMQVVSHKLTART